jgi:hypothetical protein
VAIQGYSRFFPATLRGHGIKHQPFPIQRRHPKQPRCVQGGCRGDHEGRGDNMDDFREERGLHSRRADKARANTRKALEKELRKRAEYVPAARIPEEPPYVARVKCESCGRKPSGQKNDEGLTFGICGRCWTRGYSMKHHKHAKDMEAAA